MQLDRFLAGHIAPLHSPTRERRELGFAAGKKPSGGSGSGKPLEDDGNPLEQGTEKPQPIEGTAQQATIAAGQLEQSVQVKNVLSGAELLASPEYAQAFHSADIADYLIQENRINEKQLTAIAKEAAIRIDDPQQKDLPLYARVLRNTTPEKKSALIAAMAPMIQEHLQENPETTLKGIWRLRDRIDRQKELSTSLKDMLKIDDAVRQVMEIQEDVLASQDQTRDNALHDGVADDPIMEKLESKLSQFIKHTVRAKTTDGELERAFADHFHNIERLERRTLSQEERTNMRIDAMTEIIRNAQKKLRAKKNIGGAQPGGDAHVYEKPDTYIEKLETQERGMRALLDAQLRERSLQALNRHIDRIETLVTALGIPGVQTLEDAQRVLLTRASPAGDAEAEDFERRFLAIHGVSAIVMLKDFDKLFREVRRQYRVAIPKDALPEERYALPPPIDDDAFLEHAREDLALWDERHAEVQHPDGDRRNAEPELARLRTEQADTERWACEMGKIIREIDAEMPDGKAWDDRILAVGTLLGIPETSRPKFLGDFKHSLDALRDYADKDTPQARAELRADLAKCITPAGFPQRKQWQIEQCLGLLRKPELMQRTIAEAQTLHERAAAETKDKTNDGKEAAIENICTQTRKRLDQIIGVLLPVRPNTDQNDAVVRRDVYRPLQHELTLFLKIDGALRGRQAQLQQQLDAASAGKSTDADAALKSALWAESEVDKLWRCRELLDDIAARREFANDMDPTVLAAYDRKRCVIKINAKLKTQQDMDDAYQHERGHAILHILTERSGLFPNLVSSMFQANAERKDGQGREFRELLLGLSGYGSYRHLAGQHLGESATREAFTEELLVRYADWKSSRRKEDQGHFHPNELALFKMLDQGNRPLDGKDAASETLQQSARNLGHLAEFHQEEGENPQRAAQEIFPMKEYLAESERALQNIKQFLAAYEKEGQRLPRDVYDSVNGLFGEGDAELKDLQEKFRNQALWSNGVAPEKHPPDQERVKRLRAFAEKLEGVTSKYDAQRLDTTKDGRHVGLWDSVMGGIRFLSVNDVIKLWKDTWEDIQSIYKRKQDRLLKDVGYALTKPLQDSAIVKMIPGLKGYLPGLHAYHQRRYSGTEVEASDKWKDGMKNEDSHSLLHFLASTKNKDAVRGIISLLCDRGEMDWNDTGVWETLKALSGYDMPIGPCLRSDVLRDTWLRKIISYVWNDKELYYHWRAENDSKTKSGKEHFTPWVDQLSNVKGGMRAELHKQLKLFTEWSQPPHHGTPPEDVKPHLYEKVIHYAIANGKMTMEDKFYYLIRGVASGILSIDRLRTLAGEEGGVLNQFPFIDYFYGRHNTLPEIQALAKRLSEKKDGVDTFEPGTHTTLWIQLELARDPKVLERLSKGTSRTSSETIDHEDVPLFLPQLDFNSVRNMANVISGSRQKMSPEALKNLYCGYSSKFKVFGRLAQLDDQDQLDRFTPEDASKLADAIGAYVDVDNILTRKAYESDARPTLTRTQLNQMAVSGDGQHTVMEYRRNVHQFVARLVQRLRAAGANIEQTAEWKTFQKQYKKQEGGFKEVPDQQGRPVKQYVQEENFTVDDFVTKEGEADQLKSNKADTARKLFEGTKYFVDALKKLLPQHVNILKDTLKEFVRDDESSFFDEGGSSGDGGITYAKAKEAVAAREFQRQYQLQLEQGGH